MGKKGVSVTGGKDVFVGRLVSTRVGGTGLEVGVQAKELMLLKALVAEEENQLRNDGKGKS